MKGKFSHLRDSVGVYVSVLGALTFARVKGTSAASVCVLTLEFCFFCFI